MSISSAATGLFSNWNVRADLEDDLNVAVDQATVAMLHLHAPELVSLYLADDLPGRVERLLDRALAVADAIAGVRDGTSYVQVYRKVLVGLLQLYLEG
jgi:hypothetical protein